jgi:hypothetical protein
VTGFWVSKGGGTRLIFGFICAKTIVAIGEIYF